MKKSTSCGLNGSEPRLRSWSMSRASQESFCRWRSFCRFCQMRQAATSPPMMAKAYIHLAEKSMRLLVLGDGHLEAGQRGGDLDLAGEPRVLAVMGQLAEQVALVGHRRGAGCRAIP